MLMGNDAPAFLCHDKSLIKFSSLPKKKKKKMTVRQVMK